jgi:transposase
VLVDSDGALIEHGAPLVDDPGRVGTVDKLGVDETSWLKTNREHPTLYATEMVDLDAGIVIDMVKGNAAADLRRWLETKDPAWLAGITRVTPELAESYRARLSPHFEHATRVADSPHVVRVGNRCLDQVRRRVHHRPCPTGPQGRSAVSNPQAAAKWSGATRRSRS